MGSSGTGLSPNTFFTPLSFEESSFYTLKLPERTQYGVQQQEQRHTVLRHSDSSALSNHLDVNQSVSRVKQSVIRDIQSYS